jgi:hypothetical protein
VLLKILATTPRTIRQRLSGLHPLYPDQFLVLRVAALAYGGQPECFDSDRAQDDGFVGLYCANYESDAVR